jgi:hypothetical protein
VDGSQVPGEIWGFAPFSPLPPLKPQKEAFRNIQGMRFEV